VSFGTIGRSRFAMAGRPPLSKHGAFGIVAAPWLFPAAKISVTVDASPTCSGTLMVAFAGLVLSDPRLFAPDEARTGRADLGGAKVYVILR